MKIFLAFACLVVAASASDSCDPTICLMHCEYGFALNEEGCPICECKPSPCATVRCSAGTVCVLKDVQCVTEPCLPVPECKNVTEVREACSDPLKIGPCKAAIPRFYYNSETNACDSFSWGGCDANGNNFESHSSCSSQCIRNEPRPRCPPVCAIFCEFGNVLDENGCPTCTCKPNPCDTVRCRAGTVCELEDIPCEETVCELGDVQCVSQPCLPVPVCKNISVVQGACSDPLKIGPCRAAIPRFYYNSETNTCDSFSWGGCDPNGNNFDSHASCASRCLRSEPTCPPVCAIYCEFGNVLDENGCPTCTCNPNPCDSVECAAGQQCVLEPVVCKREPCLPTATCKPVQNAVEACNAPLKIGPCRGAFPRYYFNSATQQCEQFSWGGCDPNANNFETLAICESHCPAAPVCPPVCAIFCAFGNVVDENGCPTCECNPHPCEAKECSMSEVCVLQQVNCVRAPCYPEPVCKRRREVRMACRDPKKEGPCEALIPRYFYNSQTNRCERFQWGGCEPNKNNFDTLSICQSHCERNRMVRRRLRVERRRS